MEFETSIKNLREAAQKAQVTIGGAMANLQEILKNYMIQVEDDGKFLIIGTDLEIAMVSRSDCSTVKAGQVLVDAKKFTDILRYASGETLNLKNENGKLTIKGATGSWSLLTQVTDEYPIIKDFNEDEGFYKIPRKIFISSIGKVKHSICDDEARKNFTAVVISNNQVISTNGKLASAYELTSSVADKSELPEAKIPSRAVSPMLRILNGSESETFDLQLAKSFYYMRLGDSVFSIRRSSINFPIARTLKMLDTFSSNAIKVNVSRVGLISAIEQARLTSSQNSQAIHLSISEKEIKVASKDELGNNARHSVSCILDGEVKKLSVFYNWLNLLTSLKSLKQETITLLFNDQFDKNPLFMQENSFRTLIVPLKNSFKLDF